MHGTMNLKFSEAKQAKEIYQYKNSKRKLYKTNASIWYNKICRLKRLTPTYINIHIYGNNKQCRRVHILPRRKVVVRRALVPGAAYTVIYS